MRAFIILLILLATINQTVPNTTPYPPCFPFCDNPGFALGRNGFKLVGIGPNEQIKQNCIGASCNQQNYGEVKATQECIGGNCGQENADQTVDSQSCQGADCKQNNAGGSIAEQTCVGSHCRQNNADGAEARQSPGRGRDGRERERAATGESHSDVSQGVGWYIHEMMKLIIR